MLTIMARYSVFLAIGLLLGSAMPAWATKRCEPERILSGREGRPEVEIRSRIREHLDTVEKYGLENYRAHSDLGCLVRLYLMKLGDKTDHARKNLRKLTELTKKYSKSDELFQATLAQAKKAEVIDEWGYKDRYEGVEPYLAYLGRQVAFFKTPSAVADERAKQILRPLLCEAFAAEEERQAVESIKASSRDWSRLRPEAREQAAKNWQGWAGHRIGLCGTVVVTSQSVDELNRLYRNKAKEIARHQWRALLENAGTGAGDANHVTALLDDCRLPGKDDKVLVEAVRLLENSHTIETSQIDWPAYRTAWRTAVPANAPVMALANAVICLGARSMADGFVMRVKNARQALLTRFERKLKDDHLRLGDLTAALSFAEKADLGSKLEAVRRLQALLQQIRPGREVEWGDSLDILPSSLKDSVKHLYESVRAHGREEGFRLPLSEKPELKKLLEQAGVWEQLQNSRRRWVLWDKVEKKYLMKGDLEIAVKATVANLTLEHQALRKLQKALQKAHFDGAWEWQNSYALILPSALRKELIGLLNHAVAEDLEQRAGLQLSALSPALKNLLTQTDVLNKLRKAGEQWKNTVRNANGRIKQALREGRLTKAIKDADQTGLAERTKKLRAAKAALAKAIDDREPWQAIDGVLPEVAEEINALRLHRSYDDTLSQAAQQLLADADRWGLMKQRSAEQYMAIQRLLAKAEAAVQDNRLTTPEKKNAYGRYQEVLSLDPENATAKRGIERIVEIYLQRAESALKKQVYRKVQRHLNKAQRIAPKALNVRRMQRKLDRHTKSNKAAKLLLEAGEAFDALRLTTPGHDNAYVRYKKVLKLDPENAEAKRGIKKIVEQYLYLAKPAMRKGNYDKTRTHLDKAEKIFREEKMFREEKILFWIVERYLRWTKSAMGREDYQNAQGYLRYLIEAQQVFLQKGNLPLAKQKMVGQLLSRAQIFENGLWLTKPGRANEPKENNALTHYKMALKLEPQNKRAINGVKRIINIYKDWFVREPDARQKRLYWETAEDISQFLKKITPSKKTP
ncbi:MAG: hypothetical protein GY862_33375 [Gammaproteobacteria bacterium]|nr:hypothetical protein [Gammaproteobacteria bacterium]